MGKYLKIAIIKKFKSTGNAKVLARILILF